MAVSIRSAGARIPEGRGYPAGHETLLTGCLTTPSYVIDRSVPETAVSPREIEVEQVLELLAVHTGRFGSQHLIMRTVNLVYGDVAGSVGPPTLQKVLTAIALVSRSGKDCHIAV